MYLKYLKINRSLEKKLAYNLANSFIIGPHRTSFNKLSLKVDCEFVSESSWSCIINLFAIGEEDGDDKIWLDNL